MLIIGAVMHKLLHIIYGVLKSGKPFDANYAVLSSIVLRWCKNEADARSRLANLEALLGMARQYEETSRNTSQSASVSGLILWLTNRPKQS